MSCDMFYFGLNVVELASLSPVSLVSGEVALKICLHGHTIDGNAKSSGSLSTTCCRKGKSAPEPPASC